jgi:hypothetical protein
VVVIFIFVVTVKVKVQGRAIHIRGRGDPKDCETLRILHFLDSQLTDDGEFFSCTRLPPFTPGRAQIRLSVRNLVEYKE